MTEPREGKYAEGRREAIVCRTCKQEAWIVYHGAHRNHTVEPRAQAERDQLREDKKLGDKETRYLLRELDRLRRELARTHSEDSTPLSDKRPIGNLTPEPREGTPKWAADDIAALVAERDQLREERDSLRIEVEQLRRVVAATSDPGP